MSAVRLSIESFIFRTQQDAAPCVNKGGYVSFPAFRYDLHAAYAEVLQPSMSCQRQNFAVN